MNNMSIAVIKAILALGAVWIIGEPIINETVDNIIGPALIDPAAEKIAKKLVDNDLV